MGDFAVGKTSLVRRFVEGKYQDRYLSTIGVNISRKTIRKDQVQLNLLLWDLAGGEDFVKYQSSYLRGAVGALVVCDITRSETIKDLARYAEQIRAVNPVAGLVFLANKSDLENRFDFEPSELAVVSRSWNCPYLLTSAKTGHQVDEAFLMLAEQIESST